MLFKLYFNKVLFGLVGVRIGKTERNLNQRSFFYYIVSTKTFLTKQSFAQWCRPYINSNGPWGPRLSGWFWQKANEVTRRVRGTFSMHCHPDVTKPTCPHLYRQSWLDQADFSWYKKITLYWGLNRRIFTYFDARMSQKLKKVT